MAVWLVDTTFAHNFQSRFMRKLLVLILITSVMMQTFSKGVLLLSYYTNTGVYAANCENKARPQLHCNGKCQLSKKIKEEERKEQQEKRTAEPQMIFMSPEPIAELQPAIAFESFSVKFLPLTIGFPADYYGTFFHPPATA